MRRAVILSLIMQISIFVSAQDDLTRIEKKMKFKNELYRSINNNKGFNLFEELMYVADETRGIGISYGDSYQVSIQGGFTYLNFMLTADVGFNLNDRTYIKSTNEDYNPVLYGMLVPGFYCRYLSVNCGVGLLYGNLFERSFSSAIVGNGSSITSNLTETTYSRYDLGIKPSLTGYIPIVDEDYYITVNVGYLIVPAIKKLNGFMVGIGFQKSF